MKKPLQGPERPPFPAKGCSWGSFENHRVWPSLPSWKAVGKGYLAAAALTVMTAVLLNVSGTVNSFAPAPVVQQTQLSR